MGGHHQGVGRRVGLDPHRLLATDVVGAGVVSRGEESGDLRRIAARKLEHPQWRHVRRLEDVEGPHELLDRPDLGGIAPHPQAVGRIHHFNGRRRDHPAVADRHGSIDHLLQRGHDFGGPGLPDRDHAGDGLGGKQLPCFGQRAFEGLDRRGRPENLEDAGRGVHHDFGPGKFTLGQQGRLAIERHQRLFEQGVTRTGSDPDHPVGHVTRLRAIERPQEAVDRDELIRGRGDHQQVEFVDRFEGGRHVDRTVLRLENRAGERGHRTDQPTRRRKLRGELSDHRLGPDRRLRGIDGLLEAIERLPRSFDHQPPRRRIEIGDDLERGIDLGTGLEDPGRPGERGPGIGRIEHQVADFAITTSRAVDEHDRLPDRIEIADGTRRDEAAAVRTGDQLQHRRLPGREDRSTSRDRRIGRRVRERKQHHGITLARRAGTLLLQIREEAGRLLQQGRLGGDGDSIGVFEHHVGGLVLLGHALEELVELRLRLRHGEAVELDGPHRHHRLELFPVEQFDRGAEPFDPARRATGDDRVGAFIRGDPEARGHHVLFDLDLRLAPGDRLDHAFAHELQQGGEQISRLGISQGDLFDLVLDVFAIEFVHDQLDASRVRGGLHHQQ